MTETKLQPIQLNQFAHINEIEPISAEDDACLADVRQVLERHGAVDRFGLILLHKHFPVAEDEILVESCDEQARTLVSRPMKKSTLDQRGGLVQTVWAFGGHGTRACQKYCPTDSSGKHSGSSAHH